ncbi:MAG: PepSY domain-containing protein [Acidimicrobiia bacterium]
MMLAAAAGAVTAGVLGAGVLAVLDDPARDVAAIRLTQASDATGTGTGREEQVPPLEELIGRVEREGDDGDDLRVGRVELDFGPDSWIATAGPTVDLDGDGATEELAAELDGLVGREVRLLVRFDDDDDEDATVFVVDGRTYREIGGPAPWPAAGAVGEAAVRAAAIAAVGEGSRVVELDAEEGTAVAWEAEVVDRQGREHEVLLDATGKVIDVSRD